MVPPPKFVAPEIADNSDGWGPCGVPDKYVDLPFQNFSKADKVGKIADWTGNLYSDRKYGRNVHHRQHQLDPNAAQSQYAYFHANADDDAFKLVSWGGAPTMGVQRTAQQRAARTRQMQMQRRLAAQKERERRIQGVQQATNLSAGGAKAQRIREKDRQKAVRKYMKQFGNRQRNDGRRQAAGPRKPREPSVAIQPEWNVVEEIEFSRLHKLNLPNVGVGDDIGCYGAMEYYDRTYDRLNTRSERHLSRNYTNRLFYSKTTTDDVVIQRLAAKPEYRVFATDSILSTLMCAPRSVYGWDLLVHRVADKVFFDKRPDSQFDYLNVSETAMDPPVDEEKSINSPKNLALEATVINKCFSQQVLRADADRYRFDNPNPFVDEGIPEEQTASVGYRYRVFDLGLGDNAKLVCRCEHDAVMVGPNQETQFLTIKAFNEWDSRFSGGVDWRSKLDTQRGAVLATELRNNSNKLAKWTVQAMLAGSDAIRFGYVSRVQPRDSANHVILGMQQFKPNELASQITLSMDNAWGILRCLVDMTLKLPAGKYLFMKDPNKPMLRLYNLPESAFDDDNDLDDDEDED